MPYQKKDEKAGEESGRANSEVLPLSSSAKAGTLCEHFRSFPQSHVNPSKPAEAEITQTLQWETVASYPGS